MTDQHARRPDARHCPDCGARGILPLEQPHTADGGIQDPVMICPICETEFRATGSKWLGAIKPPTNWESLSEEAKSKGLRGWPTSGYRGSVAPMGMVATGWPIMATTSSRSSIRQVARLVRHPSSSRGQQTHRI